MGARARFDVLVVGSGASGGWAAKRLGEAGLDVALLEAGRARTAGDDREHVPAFSLPYRDRAPEVVKRTRPVQKDCYACTEWNHDWFANDLEEPYTTAKDRNYMSSVISSRIRCSAACSWTNPASMRRRAAWSPLTKRASF